MSARDLRRIGRVHDLHSQAKRLASKGSMEVGARAALIECINELGRLALSGTGEAEHVLGGESTEERARRVTPPAPMSPHAIWASAEDWDRFGRLFTNWLPCTHQKCNETDVPFYASALDAMVANAEALGLYATEASTNPIGMVRIDADGGRSFTSVATYERERFPGDWRPCFLAGGNTTEAGTNLPHGASEPDNKGTSLL